jgi:altronate dehydratase
METPTNDDVEIVTGLGATGVEVIVVYGDDSVLPGNPMVPTIRVGGGAEVDVKVDNKDSAEVIAEILLQLISEVRNGRRRTSADRLGNVAFQITRGYEGISL